MDLHIFGLLALALALGYVLLFFLLKRQLRDTFSSLASKALVDNNQHFVGLAQMTLEKFHSEAQGDLCLKQQAIQQLVNPLRETLQKYEQQINELERKREHAYGGLRQYLQSMVETQSELRKETGNLVKALRASHVRGKWGEISLKRTVEMAGLVEHCDFTAQESLSSEESRLRPDMIIHLPGGRRIVIDAKAPLDSYIQAVDTEDEQQREQLTLDHARQLERRISLLGGKGYWEQLEGSPEFVVLYLPLESLLSVALRVNPDLLEKATEKRVILATPTTLIALLKAIEYGWKQEKLAKNAEEISGMGKDLYDRILKLSDHLSKLGVALDRAVQAYNETAGSYERRVLVQARRFKELGVSGKEEIPEAAWIDHTPRTISPHQIGQQPTEAAGESVEEDLEEAKVSV